MKHVSSKGTRDNPNLHCEGYQKLTQQAEGHRFVTDGHACGNPCTSKMRASSTPSATLLQRGLSIHCRRDRNPTEAICKHVRPPAKGKFKKYMTSMRKASHRERAQHAATTNCVYRPAAIIHTVTTSTQPRTTYLRNTYSPAIEDCAPKSHIHKMSCCSQHSVLT